MVGAIEILGADGIGHVVPGAGIEQKAAKDGLLCLYGMRGRAQQAGITAMARSWRFGHLLLPLPAAGGAVSPLRRR